MKVPRYVVLDKPVGQTPLETIRALQAAHPEYQELPASYAGRLDPMASGLLLVLLGEECKRKESYLGLDKEYEIEILLDVGSDTGDVLGIVSENAMKSHPEGTVIRTILRNELGTHLRPYPSYSSKTVDGVPLFLHAIQGTLGSIRIPEHTETLYKIDLLSISFLSPAQVRARIEKMLAVAPRSDEPSKILGADFRIAEVRASWSEVFDSSERDYAVLRLCVICGSGAYMRTLAERIGAALNTRALAHSIHRTRLGMYKKIGPFGFWTRQFSLTIH